VKRELGLEGFLLDQVEAALIATDPAGVVTFWNRYAEELLGYPVQEAIGRDLVSLVVGPDDREAVVGILEGLGTGESWQGEIDVRARDGRPIPARLRASPAYDDAGVFVGMASVLVDITDLRLAERRRAAQYAVTEALSEAETLADATPRILEAIGEGLGWEIGALWEIDPRAGRLRCVDTWQAPLARVDEFDALTRQIAFPAGVGLPGRVWRSGEPAWIADVVRDENFPRASVAAQDGLRGALGFPIVLEGAVLGVIEFFSSEIREPDHDLVAMMSSIGSQIGQFVERKAAEEAALEQAERARGQMAFLAEASALLTSSLDYRKTLSRVAKLAVPWLADWCSVDVLEEGELRAVAMAHADPEQLERARELRRRWPPGIGSTRGAPEVIRSGASRLYEEIPDELLVKAALDEEHLEVMRRLGFRSAMIVPLVARGRTFGAITFVSAGSGRRYGTGDLTLAEELARRAAQAVDNARLYQERARVARALQQSLLPQHLPQIEWCEVAARYRAAGQGEVGGDFYDAFEARDGALFAAIGDVQGKGPEAAAVTGLARYTIRAAARTERNPSRILRSLNEVILREWTDRFATVALVRIQLMNGSAQIAVSCAGHPLPFILRSSGAVEAAQCPGNLLGVFPEIEVSDHIAELEPGDALVMYTDGVTEEHAGNRVFGEDRLTTLLASLAGEDADTIAGRVEQAVLDFGEPEPRDDMAVLVLRLRPGVASAAEAV
jgi:PAS domain S-box-containing protein